LQFIHEVKAQAIDILHNIIRGELGRVEVVYYASNFLLLAETFEDPVLGVAVICDHVSVYRVDVMPWVVVEIPPSVALMWTQGSDVAREYCKR
jgi:hypothetical protein